MADSGRAPSRRRTKTARPYRRFGHPFKPPRRVKVNMSLTLERGGRLRCLDVGDPKDLYWPLASPVTFIGAPLALDFARSGRVGRRHLGPCEIIAGGMQMSLSYEFNNERTKELKVHLGDAGVRTYVIALAPTSSD